jgi:hypothetical protein
VFATQNTKRQGRADRPSPSFISRRAADDAKEESPELGVIAEACSPVDHFEICSLQHVLRGSSVPPTARERPPEGGTMMASEFVVEIGHDQR